MTYGEKLAELSMLSEGTTASSLFKKTDVRPKVIYVDTAPMRLGTGEVMSNFVVEELTATFSTIENEASIEVVEISADVTSKKE